MKTRIISALCMIAVLTLLAQLDNWVLNLAVLCILFCIAFHEARVLFDANNASLLAGLAIFLCSALFQNPILMGLCLCVLVLGVCAYFNLQPKNIYPFLYPLLPMLALWQILEFEGMRIFIWLLVIVGGCDCLAYFTGKAFGKHSFCKTSPNKTWEGIAGGLIGALILGTLFGVFWLSNDLLSLVKISLFVALFAIIGDLIESYFKRLAGVKDSGSLIPGHGGVLDRLDAAMIAALAMLVVL